MESASLFLIAKEYEMNGERFLCAGITIGVLSLTSCVSVNPISKPGHSRCDRPVFGDVQITGLVFEDRHEVGSTESTAVANGYSQFEARGRSSGTSWTANGRGSAFGVASGTSVTYANYDNYSLQNGLRLALEDSHVVRRIVQSGPVEIEGLILSTERTTGGGKILWNIVNSVSLLCLFGGPYLGTVESHVQLRVRQNGELIGTWEGCGEASWLAIYHLRRHISEGRRQSGIIAAELAVKDAVSNLAANPPKLTTTTEGTVPK